MKKLKFHKIIGKGNQGIVGLYENEEHEYIVIKHINCQNIEQVNIALKECMLIKELKHCNIIEYLDISIDLNNELFVNIYMNYYKEGDLESFIQNIDKIEQEMIIDFGIQLSQGIYYLHEKNLIHRDIKPENILLKKENNKIELVITDFGLCKLIDQTLTQSICGSLYYIAPEIMEFGKYSNSVDIFSLGCIFYYLMTKKKRVLYLDIIKNNINDISKEIQRNYNNKLCNLVMKMLNLNPKERPSIKQVFILLEEIKNNNNLEMNNYIENYYNPNEIHYLIICNHCSQNPIIGKRFKCKICNDFDLCEKCISSHDSKHSFEIIYKSIHQKLPSSEIHDEIICDGCQICPIIGLRFQCLECFAFDYCEKCYYLYHEKHENGQHNFIDLTRRNYYHSIFNFREIGNWKKVITLSQSLLFIDHKEYPALAFLCEANFELKNQSEKYLEILNNLLDIDDNDSHNLFAKGIVLNILKKYQESFYFLLKSAKSSHIMSQNFVGEYYFFGLGIKKDFEQASKWFHISAKRGDSRAQYHLGLISLMNGDQKRSFEWFKRSSNNGNMLSMYQLGKLYLLGIVGNKREKGIQLLKQASSEGLEMAQRELEILKE